MDVVCTLSRTGLPRLRTPTTEPRAVRKDRKQRRRRRTKLRTKKISAQSCLCQRVMARLAPLLCRRRGPRKARRRTRGKLGQIASPRRRHEEATGMGIQTTVKSVSTVAVTFRRLRLVGSSINHRSIVFGGNSLTKDTPNGKQSSLRRRNPKKRGTGMRQRSASARRPGRCKRILVAESLRRMGANLCTHPAHPLAADRCGQEALVGAEKRCSGPMSGVCGRAGRQAKGGVRRRENLLAGVRAVQIVGSHPGSVIVAVENKMTQAQRREPRPWFVPLRVIHDPIRSSKDP